MWLYIYIYIYIYIYWPVDLSCRIHRLLLCRGVRPPHPMSVLIMTLNNLMVRFQWGWNSGECGVTLHYHRSQVYSRPAWARPLRRTPRSLFWTSVRSVAQQMEQWQTWDFSRHLVSTRLPSGGRAALLSPLSPMYGTRPRV